MDNKNQPNDNSSQNELDLGFNHSDSVTPRKPVQQSGSIFDKAKGLFGKKEQPDTQFHVRREPTFGAAASQPFSPSQAFQSENTEQSASSSAFGSQEPVENVQVESVAEEKVIFENSPAEEIVEEFGKYLGHAMANLAAVADPSAIVIGGGVSKAGEVLLQYVEKNFKEKAFFANKDTEFVLATLGNDAGICGAAKLIL